MRASPKDEAKTATHCRRCRLARCIVARESSASRGPGMETKWAQLLGGWIMEDAHLTLWGLSGDAVVAPASLVK